MPPAPRALRISYGPSLVPAASMRPPSRVPSLLPWRAYYPASTLADRQKTARAARRRESCSRRFSGELMPGNPRSHFGILSADILPASELLPLIDTMTFDEQIIVIGKLRSLEVV